MRLSDITVEVRDKALVRRGLIRPEDLDLKLTVVGKNVGAWTLELADEHPMATVLRLPGSGIIVTGSHDVIASGPVVAPTMSQSPADPAGTLQFEGVTDDHIAGDYLCYPKPDTASVAAQTLAHDERTGNCEDLMHAYVKANCGPLAPAARRVANLANGTSLGRGPTVTKKPRFAVLGNVLEELALLGGLGFRFVQRGDKIVFETYAITDRTGLIRLDVRNNTLAGQKVSIQSPTLTRAIVAGQGEQEERKFIERSSATSRAAELAFGRRIERFVDQRNTNDDDELAQAGDELLLDEGFVNVAVQAIPMDDTMMELGRDWFVGDYVNVVVDGQELKTEVTGFLMQASSDGFKVGATLGDPEGFSWRRALYKRVRRTEARIQQLEANAETSNTIGSDVGQLQTDVTELQDDVSGLEDDVTDLQGTEATLVSQIAALQAHQARLPYAEAAGQVTVTVASSNVPASATVTFPAGRFSVGPIVVPAPNTTVPGSSVSGVGVTGTSATSCLIWANRTSPGAVAVNWHAKQMTPTTGSG